MPLLSVRDLSKVFLSGGRTVRALDRVSFDLEPGETLAVVGPSGSGKSTLARVLLRLIEPDTGSVRFEDRDLLGLRGAELRRMRAGMQMVFQDPLAALNPRTTVAKAVSDPLRIHGVVPAPQRESAVAALLDRVGLPAALAARRPHELSGGQRQRVAIARAIATRPALVVLDEATSALDVSVRAGILDLLRDLQRRDGIAYLFIAHDLGVVRAVADRMIVLDAGRVVEQGTPADVIGSPRSEAARALVAAAPRLVRERSKETP